MLLLLHPQHGLLLLLLLGVDLLVVLLLLLHEQLLDDEVGVLAELLRWRHLSLLLGLLVELLLSVEVGGLEWVVSRMLLWSLLVRICVLGHHVRVENRCVHLQTGVRLRQIAAYRFEIGHEAMGLFVGVAVDFLIELVADDLELSAVLLGFQVVENRKKDLQRQHSVRACLMHSAFAHDAQVLTDSLQAGVKPNLAVHERLYVQQPGEEDFEQRVVLVLVLRQFLIRQNLDKVSHIKTPVEADPRQMGVQHQTR